MLCGGWLLVDLCTSRQYKVTSVAAVGAGRLAHSARLCAGWGGLLAGGGFLEVYCAGWRSADFLDTCTKSTRIGPSGRWAGTWGCGTSEHFNEAACMAYVG